MNKQQLILKVVVLTVLCGNQMSLGMEVEVKKDQESFNLKRKGKEDYLSQKLQSIDLQKENKEMTLQDWCRDAFKLAIRPLTIESYKKHLKLDQQEGFGGWDFERKINHLGKVDRDKRHRDRIDKLQDIRYKFYIQFPEGLIKDVIAYESEELKKHLFECEEIAATALVESFGIDVESQEWQDCVLKLKEREQLVIQSMQQSRNDTTWSYDLPIDVVTCLMNIMEEYGLKPSAFNIRPFEDDEDGCIGFKDPQSADEPGCFYINSKKMAALKSGKLLFLINHVMVHLLEMHYTKYRFLTEVIMHIKNLKNDQIASSCEFAKYRLAQETIADTILAIGNKKIMESSIGRRSLHANSYGILKIIESHFGLLEYFDQQKSDNKVII